jgi:hypothetical protein
MSYFGIENYQPQWLNGQREIAAVHGRRLQALAGRYLTRAWVLWDLGDDEWFADCPVLLDFEGEQVEIQHHRFDDLSITWNSVNPSRPVAWSEFRLGWRHDTVPELAALRGQPLETVELLTLADPTRRKPRSRGFSPQPTVDLGFTFGRGHVTIYNALDENGLSFADPEPRYVRHSLS